MSLDDVAIKLKRLRSVSQEAVSNWIRENAGPLPAVEMPERVANVVLKLITEKSGLGRHHE